MCLGDRDATEVPLYHIESPIVEKVIEYMTYHMTVPARKIEKPLLSNQMKDLVDKFDANFIEVNQETLFKLLLVTHIQNTYHIGICISVWYCFLVFARTLFRKIHFAILFFVCMLIFCFVLWYFVIFVCCCFRPPII